MVRHWWWTGVLPKTCAVNSLNQIQLKRNINTVHRSLMERRTARDLARRDMSALSNWPAISKICNRPAMYIALEHRCSICLPAKFQPAAILFELAKSKTPCQRRLKQFVPRRYPVSQRIGMRRPKRLPMTLRIGWLTSKSPLFRSPSRFAWLAGPVTIRRSSCRRWLVYC